MTARKTGGRRQRRNTTDLEVIGGAPASACPPAPHPATGPKLYAETVELWASFWASDVAGAVTPADRPALVRLFRAYDERERYARKVRKDPLSTGSQGQPILHPFTKELARLDSLIGSLEDRFGLTPRARLGLGLQATGLRKSVEELNREFAAPDELEVIDGDVVDDVDPRRAAR
jgi:hypothetical protein